MYQREAKSRQILELRPARVCAWITIVLGVLALISRVVDIPELRGAGTPALEMKPNAALGFILAGFSILCFVRPETVWRRMAHGLAIVVTLLGVATLFEIVFGLNLHIDEILMSDLPARLLGERPGLMVPASAVNFLFGGVALLTLDWRTRQGRFPSQWLTLVLPLAPMQVLIAYSHGVSALLRIGPYPQLTQMAPHTAFAWISLSIGTLAARPTNGFVSALFSNTYSSATFRRLLPLAAIAPTALAWITVKAGNWNLYHPGFGISFFTLIITLLLVSVVWRTYVKLVQYEQRLSDALDTRDEFISIASHELKGPLTTLKLQLQLLAKKSEVRGLPLRSSMKQVDRISSLIDDMLDVSRIQAGQMSFHFEPVNLTDLVRDILNRFSSQFSAANVHLEAQVDDGLLCDCDKVRIEQVLGNLISNAIKYAPDSSVKVKARAAGSFIQLKVQDFGPGIPLEKQAIIFDRFERGGIHSGAKGLGLGLYICKRIIEAHCGSIRVESEPGKGATFIVDLKGRIEAAQGLIRTERDDFSKIQSS
ncbi:MAG: HAMP domain-containing sensor histidine kinase [Bdellovibrionia bacterium]